MIAENQTLKKLKSQLAKANGDYEALKIQVENIQKNLSSKKDEIKGLVAKIKRLEHPTDLEVSEHALLRYFERVLGFDLNSIKSKILDDEVRRLSGLLGENGIYPNKENVRVVVKNNIVTTVVL